MKRIIMGICIFILLFCLCWAGELTGRDIMLKVDAVDTSKDYRMTAVMVINRILGKKMMRCERGDMVFLHTR